MTNAAAAGQGKPGAKIFFFVDNHKIETDQPALTGAQIKAKVPDWQAGYGLMLEGHGQDPDTIVTDEQLVQLAKDPGPLRFAAVPPASYGVA